MNDFANFFIILILFAAIFVVYFIKRQITIRRNRFCPHCKHKMEVQRRSRDIEPKKERVHIGKVRIISGSAKEYWSVIYCDHCGYEFRI